MKTIQVSSLFFQIDDEDFLRVSKRKWYLNRGYAYTGYKFEKISMHHFILGFEPGSRTYIIRKDKNLLNNQKSNLIVGRTRKLRTWEHSPSQRAAHNILKSFKKAHQQQKLEQQLSPPKPRIKYPPKTQRIEAIRAYLNNKRKPSP